MILRVSILSTFSADPLAPELAAALEALGFRADVQVGPYAQIAQECLAPGSVTERFAPDVLVVWPMLEDLWGGLASPLDGDHRPYIALATELAETCLAAARRWQATLVFALPSMPAVNPLGIGDASALGGSFATATATRLAVQQHLAGRALLVDVERVVRELGANAAFDARLMDLAHLPFSLLALTRVAEVIARLVQLGRGVVRKAVVVDADNTLWGGVVGEDGAEGIVIGGRGLGAAYRAFQHYLRDLRRAGWLLALCSKNNEADLWSAFARPEMVLARDDFAAWRIGWSPKSIALHEIADELGIGIDSLVFIDDSRAELAEVGASAPEVTCIQMPSDPADWRRAVVLDRLPPTADDLLRADFYRHERVRREVRNQASSYEEYLANLGVRISIAPPRPSDLPRLGQLVAKTNQFNLNCRRWTEAELAALCASSLHLARLVSARDRFGDYGVVGAMLAEHEPRGLRLQTFVLSCRALGRGIERAMVAALFAEAREITAMVEVAPRNQPARAFFAELGCDVSGTQSQLQQVSWPVHIVRDEPSQEVTP